MNPEGIAELIAVVGIILIPSIGLTARFALKPIVDSVLRVRDALDRPGTPAPQDARMDRLEERMTQLQDVVERLAQTVEFDRQLRAGAPGADPRLGPGATPPQKP